MSERGSFGFEWGPLEVIRLAVDVNSKNRWLALETERERIEVRITKGGRMHVHRAKSLRKQMENATATATPSNATSTQDTNALTPESSLKDAWI
jgi:hypothetical protein